MARRLPFNSRHVSGPDSDGSGTNRALAHLVDPSQQAVRVAILTAALPRYESSHLRHIAAFWPLRSQSGEAVCSSWPAPERQRVAGARADPPSTCRERDPGGR